jgi:hypothetical protein
MLSEMYKFRKKESMTSLNDALEHSFLIILFYSSIWLFNQDRSAAIFCHQIAAWVSDMLCDLTLVKNHKIKNSSTTSRAREK